MVWCFIEYNRLEILIEENKDLLKSLIASLIYNIIAILNSKQL